MRFFLFASLGYTLAFGAPTVSVPAQGISPQQVIMSIAGASASCTLEVSENPTYTPPIPDVNASLYAGSNIDTSRPDTITQASGTRLVTIGHRLADRSLFTVTTFYYRVSGCGTTATGSFITSNLGNGTTMSQQTPFDSTKWGNMALPGFDWTTPKNYVDPLTGIRMKPINLTYQTWRTGGGSSGAVSGFQTFADWAGGTGWTNPANILNGSTSTASTGNTNPLDLFADWSTESMVAYNPGRVLEDVGAVLYGKASGSGADATITLDLRKHGVSCGTVSPVLPTSGSIAHVFAALSTDPDAAFPPNFPSQPFRSWSGSVSPCLHNEDMQTSGTLSVSGSALTIATPTAANSFSVDLAAGDRIHISGSSPGCTNSLCTIATVTDSGHATVSETPSGTGSQTYIAYGWLIRVTKNTATGTVGIGLKYKLAGSSFSPGVEAGAGDKCGKPSQFSGDAITGYVCQITSIVSGFFALMFVGNEGTTRIFYDQIPPSVAGIGFDPVIGNVFYRGSTNGSGGRGISKLTYTGDYTTSIDYAYGCASNGVCQTLNEHMTVADLMPHSGTPATGDLQQQIATNFPSYNSSLFGTWDASNSNVNFYGSSGHWGVFCNVYSGQGQPNSGGPGWCAKVDLSTTPATVVDVWHTLDGSASCPNCRFGSLHTASAQDSADNVLLMVLDMANANSTSTLLGGPFVTDPDGVLLADGVTWDTNTCLDWPTNSGVGCAHRASNPALLTCPGGTSYTTCITLRMLLPGGKVPNKSATAAEITAYPCAGSHPTWSCPTTMTVGDNAVDLKGSLATDDEHFRPLTITVISGDSYKVAVGRNAVYDYCSISPWQGTTNSDSAQFAGQLVHNDAWTWTMAPGHRADISNSCGSSTLFINLSTNAVAEMGHSFSGHIHLGQGPTTGNLSAIGQAKTAYNQTFASIDQIPPVVSLTPGPTWQGNNANVGAPNFLQSYVDESQYNAGVSNFVWAIDTNPLVACAAEQLGCGPLRTLTHITGDIYRVQMWSDLTANEATYKVQPLMGASGRFVLQDVSGPSSSVDSTPYSTCIALVSNQCHAGSTIGQIYQNIPKLYDTTSGGFSYFPPSQSWMNSPGAFMGFNAPGGFSRQFRISADDPTGGRYSRALTTEWSSFGRHWPFAYASMHPAGRWMIVPATQYTEGHGLVDWLVDVPAWQPDSIIRNNFVATPISVTVGNAYARVRFGYGENGLPADGRCTAYAESCITDPAVTPYAFITTDSASLNPLSSCASGCIINVPALPMREMYYRIERSTDGVTWNTSGDINVLSIAPVVPVIPPVISQSIQFSGSVFAPAGISLH